MSTVRTARLDDTMGPIVDPHAPSWRTTRSCTGTSECGVVWHTSLQWCAVLSHVECVYLQRYASTLSHFAQNGCGDGVGGVLLGRVELDDGALQTWVGGCMHALSVAYLVHLRLVVGLVLVTAATAVM